MGLLRKAATAVSRDASEELVPAAAETDDSRDISPGLLKRSTTLRTTPAPSPEIEAPAEIPESEPLVVPPDPELVVELAQLPETSPEVPVLSPLERHVEEEIPSALPPRPPQPEQITADALLDISTLADGVELPSLLFSRLAARLGIAKGALLLYDAPRLVYAPWASVGYDQTTLHRMRIPLGANASFTALANGAPLFLAEERDRAGYQHYFSSREFAAASRIILAPFIADGMLIAVLLVTEIASPFAIDEDLLDCLASVVAAGSPRIRAARQGMEANTPRPGAARTEKLSTVGPAPVDQKADMTRFVATSGPVLLMTLSVEEYAAAVIAAHEHLDPFRLQEDISFFLGSFLADCGKAMSVRRGVFVAALTDVPPTDTDLFLHQLGLFLRGLFGEGTGEAPGPRILKVQPWPARGGDLASVIESLGS